MTSSGCLGPIFLALMFAVALAGFAAAAKRRRKEEEAPLRPTRLSLLAAMSFLCGMAALLVLVSASIVSLLGLHGEEIRLGASAGRLLRAAGEVALIASLVPAAGALALSLGARSVIRQGGEGLRGAALARAGAFLAILSGFFALGGKAWVADRFEQGLASADPERGFLGVEVELQEMDQFGRPGGARVKSVEEGGPAASAGLRAGDVIDAVDGAPVGVDRPLDAALRPHRAGARLTLQLSRDGRGSPREVVLGVSPVSALVALLRGQDSDGERLSALKAAAAHRKFRVDELARIASAFEGDDARVEAIQAGLPGLADPQNAFQLLGVLERPDSKGRLSRMLEKMPRTPPR